MLEIQIKYETKSLFLKKKLIEKIAREFLVEKGIKNTELSILITTDKKIKTLNKKYRNMDKSTDVLSFGSRRICGTIPLLGDIVISADTLKKQVKLYGNSIDDELKLLVTHGIKHLLGIHHREER